MGGKLVNLKMPILKKNHDWDEHLLKFREEAKELEISIGILDFIEKKQKESFKTPEEAAESLISETLDVIQMCIGILDKLMKSYPKLVCKGFTKHIKKLDSRGWKFKKWLAVTESQNYKTE